MPAPIVLVHDEPAVADALATALEAAGYETTVFPDALAAMIALDHPRRIRLLITRAWFAPGRSNGASLALMLRSRRENAKVLFIARPEHEVEVSDIGHVIPSGTPPAAIVAVVRTLLDADP